MILSQRNVNTIYQGILPKDQEEEENPEEEVTSPREPREPRAKKR